MQAPGLKSYIMGIVGLHQMIIYGMGKFESFIILATWGEQWEYLNNYFRYFVVVNECLYFKSLEGYR